MPVSTADEHGRRYLDDDGHRRAGAAAAGPAVAAALPSQVAALAAAQGLRQVEGFPLKHVTVQSTKMDMGGGGAGALGGLGGLGARMAGRMMGGAGGGNAETTTTIEVVDIEEVDVPGATFAIPDGYKETQLFQTGPAVPI